jgi:hypothetical protein
MSSISTRSRRARNIVRRASEPSDAAASTRKLSGDSQHRARVVHSQGDGGSDVHGRPPDMTVMPGSLRVTIASSENAAERARLSNSRGVPEAGRLLDS